MGCPVASSTVMSTKHRMSSLRLPTSSGRSMYFCTIQPARFRLPASQRQQRHGGDTRQTLLDSNLAVHLVQLHNGRDGRPLLTHSLLEADLVPLADDLLLVVLLALLLQEGVVPPKVDHAHAALRRTHRWGQGNGRPQEVVVGRGGVRASD